MRQYFAELLGTFGLVFFGTGAIIINQETSGMISHPGIAVTFGIVVMLMIFVFGDVSGAHLNPAVTIAFTMTARFPLKHLLPYVMSQCTGAILASSLLQFLFPLNKFLGVTLARGSNIQSFSLEFILTLFLMLVILQVSSGTKEKGMFAGVAVGATVLVEAMVAGPICGASMNPARSLGPAIVSGHFEGLWIYLTATIIGAMAAIPIGKYFSNHNEKIITQ